MAFTCEEDGVVDVCAPDLRLATAANVSRRLTAEASEAVRFGSLEEPTSVTGGGCCCCCWSDPVPEATDARAWLNELRLSSPPEELPREEKSSSFDGRNADAAVDVAVVGIDAAEGGGGLRDGGLAFEAAAAAPSESCLRIGGGVALPIIPMGRTGAGGGGSLALELFLFEDDSEEELPPRFIEWTRSARSLARLDASCTTSSDDLCCCCCWVTGGRLLSMLEERAMAPKLLSALSRPSLTARSSLCSRSTREDSLSRPSGGGGGGCRVRIQLD